jgi:hypothetical protein
MKRIYAEDIAMSLFDWDYTTLTDFDLYAALGEQGYEWNGASWEYQG